MLRKGKLRAEKIEYPDGVSCCVWRPFAGGDEDTGLCWDFPADELDDLIALLEQLRDAPAEEYDRDSITDAIVTVKSTNSENGGIA